MTKKLHKGNSELSEQEDISRRAMIGLLAAGAVLSAFLGKRILRNIDQEMEGKKQDQAHMARLSQTLNGVLSEEKGKSPLDQFIEHELANKETPISKERALKLKEKVSDLGKMTKRLSTSSTTMIPLGEARKELDVLRKDLLSIQNGQFLDASGKPLTLEHVETKVDTVRSIAKDASITDEKGKVKLIHVIPPHITL